MPKNNPIITGHLLTNAELASIPNDVIRREYEQRKLKRTVVAIAPQGNPHEKTCTCHECKSLRDPFACIHVFSDGTGFTLDQLRELPDEMIRGEFTRRKLNQVNLFI